MVVGWKVKVCLVGDEAVGKTSLIRRFVLDQFDDRYVITIGAKVVSKEIAFRPPGGGEEQVSLLIWDIMGARGFRELLQEAYFYNAKGILAVCDVTRPETLANLRHWVSSVNSVAGAIPCLVLANKVDLREQVAIPDGKLREACDRMGTPYLKTSAKTGENVEAAFRQLIGMIHGASPEPGGDPGGGRPRARMGGPGG